MAQCQWSGILITAREEDRQPGLERGWEEFSLSENKGRTAERTWSEVTQTTWWAVSGVGLQAEAILQVSSLSPCPNELSFLAFASLGDRSRGWDECFQGPERGVPGYYGVPCCSSAPLFADLDHHRCREELHHRLPIAHKHAAGHDRCQSLAREAGVEHFCYRTCLQHWINSLCIIVYSSVNQIIQVTCYGFWNGKPLTVSSSRGWF